MIGQNRNKDIIDTWYRTNNFPRFLVITGPEGYGKSEMAKYIINKIRGYAVYVDLGVDNVREAIKNAYTVVAPTTYIFLNAHKMSLQAKNALLKVTEEPPNNARFILTANSIDNLLSTLKSRCVELPMQEYTKEQLLEYNNSPYVMYAQCPGDLDKLSAIDVDVLYKYCVELLDYCIERKYYKAMSLANLINFSNNDDTGFDLGLVLNMLRYIVIEKCFKTNERLYLRILLDIVDSKNKLDKYNISKKGEFDRLIVRIMRKCGDVK